MASHPPTIIRHAQILLPNGEFMLGDVEIRGGTIVQIASDIPSPSDDTDIEIDANGLTLLPG